jgi:rare lipoprotein A
MEIFSEDTMTCASWDFPFNTILEVTNLNNGKKIYVRVNDRGPAERLYRQGRVVDLTKSAFAEIAGLEEGLVNITVRVKE